MAMEIDFPDTASAGAGDRYRAPALDKGLDILEILAIQPGGLTRGELVREMGRSPSEIYRMLERLVARGYVSRLDGGDRYALTMKLFLLAHLHPPLRRLIAQAQPLMDRFAAETQQSCHLVAPERGGCIALAQSSPQAHFEFRVRVGAQMDLFESASGMTILAFQARERLAETLGIWGIPEARPRIETLRADLDMVAAAGFRVAASRQLVGVTDLSAPVLNPQGDALAALTCAFVERPHTTQPVGRDTVLERLREMAAELSLTTRG